MVISLWWKLRADRPAAISAVTEDGDEAIRVAPDVLPSCRVGRGNSRRFGGALKAGFGGPGGCSRFRGLFNVGFRRFGLCGCAGRVLKAGLGPGLGSGFGFGFGIGFGVWVSLVSIEDDGHAAPEGGGGESGGRPPADESGRAGGESKRRAPPSF